MSVLPRLYGFGAFGPGPLTGAKAQPVAPGHAQSRIRKYDLEAGVLRVRRTLYESHFDEPKTKSSNRIVPLGSQGLAIFKKRKPEAHDTETLVFGSRKGTPLCRRNLSNRKLVPTCKALGLARISWHCLRHCNATLRDAVGTPLGTVQALLGHSSPETTRGIYLHSLPAGARDAVEKVEALVMDPNGPKLWKSTNWDRR